jgi:PII-like signaling protein
MKKAKEGILLRIFLSENHSHKGNCLFELIVEEARKMEMAGATVFRGIMGFQGKNKIQTSTILRLSENMPVVIEIVDTQENIKRFLPFLYEVVKDGLVTTEKANILIHPLTNS